MERPPNRLDLPAPGASPTISGVAPLARLVGRYAEASLAIGGGSQAVLLFLFDWELNVNFDFADVTAFGDAWKQFVFTDADWTARARGFVNPGTLTHYVHSYTSSTTPTALTFTGWSGATSIGTAQWTGTCYIQRGRMTAPQQGLAEQEIELRGFGIPGVGLS